jgi:hypothetical protein
MSRRTSQDLKKELMESRKKVESLEKSIEARLLRMISDFPDATILKRDTETFTCRNVTKEWLDNQSPDSMIECIRNIEEYNASQQPHVQLAMEF